jgi:mono/diheme cytochrome c family protein
VRGGVGFLLLGSSANFPRVVLAAAYLAMTGAVALRADDTEQKIKEGKQLFEQRCNVCHLPGGTGTTMLARRLGKGRSLLAERTDLTAAYIEKITRVGINGMPPLNRIELPDPELDLITIYLTRPASARAGNTSGSPGGTP